MRIICLGARARCLPPVKHSNRAKRCLNQAGLEKLKIQSPPGQAAGLGENQGTETVARNLSAYNLDPRGARSYFRPVLGTIHVRAI
jgi:hypothetical protein